MMTAFCSESSGGFDDFSETCGEQRNILDICGGCGPVSLTVNDIGYPK